MNPEETSKLNKEPKEQKIKYRNPDDEAEQISPLFEMMSYETEEEHEAEIKPDEDHQVIKIDLSKFRDENS